MDAPSTDGPVTTARDLALRARRDEALQFAPTILAGRLADERAAAHSKWFDYRFMSALAATTAFYDEYKKQYKATWARNFDLEEAEKKTSTLR